MKVNEPKIIPLLFPISFLFRDFEGKAQRLTTRPNHQANLQSQKHGAIHPWSSQTPP
jgi:hypothetical protein